MDSWTRRIRRAVLAAAAAAAFAAPGHAQDDPKSALVGSWLIEPAHYDAWVETGFDETLAFRAVRPALVDSAMGLLLLLDASAARYFRCALATLARDFPAIGQPHAGLPALAAQARELVSRGHKRSYASTLHKAGCEIDAVERWSASDERNYVADFTHFYDHPAAKASRARRLGAYLGCPERDRD